MPPNPDFNPNSVDAVLAKVLQKMEDDRERQASRDVKLDELRQQVADLAEKFEPRMKALEEFQTSLKGQIGLIAAGVSLSVTALAALIPLAVSAIAKLLKHA